MISESLNLPEETSPSWRQHWFPVVCSAVLVAISFHDYLTFHVLVESFTVGVAVMMFVVGWHTYRFSHNHFLMLLGVGYLWIGGLDIIHTLLYYGMPTALDKGNLTSQFWIATRFLEGLLLLCSPFFISQQINRPKAIALFGAIAILISSMILAGFFPDTFIDGEGLTRFKVGSEYVIIAIFIAAIFHLRHRKNSIDPCIYQLLLASIGFTIAAELAFTFYVSMYGISNLVGHITKVFSFWFIYIAVIRTSLVEPFRVLDHELKEVYALHKQAQQIAKLGHWHLDLSTNHLYWSDEIFRIFGLDPNRFSASYENFIDAIHPDDRDFVNDAYRDSLKSHKPYDIVHRLLMKDGLIKYVNEQCVTSYDEDGKPLCSTGTILDITQQKLAELKVQFMARTDPLTQLPNRTYFHSCLDDGIKHAKRSGGLLGLAMIDLDGFKPVNDTWGHQVGDEVLKSVAERLLDTFREVDTTARLGGDEFAVILDDPVSVDAVRIPLQRAVEQLRQPIQVRDHTIRISASIGVAFYPENSTDADELIRMADKALYAVKNAGRNDVRFYGESLPTSL